MKKFNINKFFYYDELSQEAQAKARENVLFSITQKRRKSAKEWRDLVSSGNLHKLINNRLHQIRFINGSKSFYKIKSQGDNYLIPFIRSNYACFTDKGEYVYYIKNCVEIISEGEIYYINSLYQKSLAEQAYIDINDRGPAYHDWLYRMHHKVKHFMVIPNKDKS